MFGKVHYELRGRRVVKLGMVDTIYQFQFATNVLEDLKGKDRDDVNNLLGDTGGGWMLETRAHKTIRYENYTYTIA